MSTSSSPALSVATPAVEEASPSTTDGRPKRISSPKETRPTRIRWQVLISMVVMHLLSLLVFLPYLFSWVGVALCFAGLYVFGTLGINLCYHRLLTHSGFKCPKWLERTFAILGVCCLQEGPARWVAVHRMHHQHSDDEPDPHSPLVTFFWGHMGWLMVENRFVESLDIFERYAPDLLRDRFYFKLEKNLNWLWIYLAHAGVFFAVAYLAGFLWTGTLDGGLQLGLSVLVWGVILRTVLVWHITWSVNSATHMWGYRNYETRENSQNNWFVALVSNGEGWHNNHHADQRSAAHGHKWWEIDVTYSTIRLLAAVGLATDVVQPRRS